MHSRYRLTLALMFAMVASLAAAQSSDPPRELLNSERIEARFGSYGIEVLASDARLRVSNLFSREAAGPVTRTFAIVLYPERIAPALAREHAAILDGGSIGATFAAAGWHVLKSHRYFGEVASAARVERLMKLDAGARLAVHIYQLAVERDGTRYDYAAIAEIHHPAYLSLAELEAIYAPGWAAAEPTDPTVLRLLDEIPRQLDGP
jgi:hypothetical protein